MNHRQVLGEILFAFGEYYDKRLTPTQIAMYVEDLLDLSADELRGACKLYRQDAKNERFPLPAKLIALARPKESPEDAGREIAANIIDAVFRDGHANPERARTRMGEDGWAIISRMGGWSQFCAELTNENLPTYRAQIRDLASTMVRRGERASQADYVKLQAADGRIAKALDQVLSKGTADGT